jgi:hypothetical protein
MTFEPFKSCWGIRDVTTAMIYTHVLNRGGKGVLGPADSLLRQGLILLQVYWNYLGLPLSARGLRV